MKFITGSSHPSLAQQIADKLFLTLEKPVIKYFKDHEISAQLDMLVESEDIVVLQSLSYPVNDHLVELLILTNELKQGKSRNVIGIIPYFGYGRSSSNAKLMAKLLEAAGINQLITIGLHNDEIADFFMIPVINLDLVELFGDDIEKHFQKGKPVIVSPDKGGEKRARALADYLKTDCIILDKKRNKDGTVEIFKIQESLAGRNCIIVDDIIDSGETLITAVKALREAGALSINAYAIHAVVSKGCLEKLEMSAIQTFVVTDTIQQTALKLNTKEVRILSVADILAEAIRKLKEK